MEKYHVIINLIKQIKLKSSYLILALGHTCRQLHPLTLESFLPNDIFLLLH